MTTHFEFGIEDLLLVHRPVQLWIQDARLHEILLVLIDNFCNDFHYSHTFREVSYAVNIDVNSVFFFIIPELLDSVLFLIVWYKLSCEFSLTIRFKYGKVYFRICMSAGIIFRWSQADWRSYKSKLESSKYKFTILLSQLFDCVSSLDQFTSIVLCQNLQQKKHLVLQIP